VIKTKACPVLTQACPPVSLACGPLGPGPIERTSEGAKGTGGLNQLYGAPGSDATDEAFWLGYYAALEALSRAERPGGE